MALRSGALLASFVFLSIIPFHWGAKQTKKDLIIRVDDFKDFKKLLRTRTNLLVVFAQSEKAASKSVTLFEEVAEEMKGKATIAFVNCGDDKKFCKKLKVSPVTFELKHYKDGEFNKDYDRKLAVKSVVNFLMDPTGDIPWDEDPTAVDVVHIDTEDGLSKLLKKDKTATLVMFYAPWCGYCKRLKPDFAAAATQMKGRAQLVGIDVDKPQMMGLRASFNITGFPTLYYFEKGKLKYRYGGENTKDGIISWLDNPNPPEEPKKEAEWADEPSEVVHLDDDNFDAYVKEHPSVLVMFYAPWCGHCKKMKPDYTEAAQIMKDQEIAGVLTAVDATKSRKLAEEYKIKGFPTLKYFKDGEYAFEVNEREKDKIIDFIKDPKEPPLPPAPEPSWEEVESDVFHLNEENFKTTLKKKKHALIMFYAPWCGHCKKAKPEFMAAAAKFKDDGKVMFGAVDCTTQQSICTTHDVTGYPTFKYFNYFNKNSQKYMGGREENDFVNFMRDPLSPSPAPSQAVPQAQPGEDWAEVEGQENIAHLTSATFDAFLQEQPSVLIMFYAPWCGHCKKMKPAFGEAATKVKENGLGALAAVDATVETALTERFEVRGYPTLKYFKNGKLAFEYKSGRSADNLADFMKDPKEPPPPPPPEADPWVQEKSEVNHLNDKTFNDFIAASPRILVMFYAPWCGHCKKMKPAFTAAAARLKTEMPEVKLAALDAVMYKDFASAYKVRGFPTIQYFENGKYKSEYNGDRSEDDLVNFFKGSSMPAADTERVLYLTQWVPALSGDNFTSTLGSHAASLVFFYRSQCPICAKYWPEFASAGKQLSNQEKSIMATVDCDTYTDLCQTEGISKYPTFTLYTGSKRAEEYKGGPVSNAFLSYLEKSAAGKKDEL